MQKTSNQMPRSLYSGCRRVMQSQSLCHYILWQILPLISRVLHTFTYTSESFQENPGCLLLQCNQPPSDTHPLVTPSGKYKPTLAERVKFKKSSCKYHNVPVPKADTIMCS